MNASAPTPTLPDEIAVVNIGLPVFGAAVREQGASAVDVAWRIPAGGRVDLVHALTLLAGPRHERVAAANAEVARRLDQGRPMLVGLDRAEKVMPGIGERTVLHSGPGIVWERMCDPLRRSVRACVVAEGWSASVADVDHLVAAGEIVLESANSHDAVLPMATAIGPSAPVFVVEDGVNSTTAFSPLNQGPGATAWMGSDGDAAVDRLVLLRETVAPVLKAALQDCGPLDVFGLVAQGLLMGDEAHMRSQATTNLLLRTLLPHLVALESPVLRSAAQFLSGNHLFFLNIAMAGAKSVLMSAYDVADSSIVVGMSRNGTDFALRVAGTGDRLFTAAAPPVGNALFHPSFGPDDAAPDIGDSAVLELVGLGAAAAAASPAVAAFLGGSVQDAVRGSEEMKRICTGRSSKFLLPWLGNRGSPLGVDACAVVESEITPGINTGILHASGGAGQVGAGVARAPLECFQAAVLALAEAD